MKKIKKGYIEYCCAGDRLETVVNDLLKMNISSPQKYYVDFNGHILYSDTVTMDSAYLAVTGLSKSDFDKREEERHQTYLEKERKHKEAIPKLTKEWIEKGHKILSTDKWVEWERCVPIRLNDLYEGMELGCCLDVIKALNAGKTFEEAKQMVNDQGHSGMSFGLMCSMFRSFYDDGEEFVKYLKGDLND